MNENTHSARMKAMFFFENSTKSSWNSRNHLPNCHDSLTIMRVTMATHNVQYLDILSKFSLIYRNVFLVL